MHEQYYTSLQGANVQPCIGNAAHLQQVDEFWVLLQQQAQLLWVIKQVLPGHTAEGRYNK